MKKEVVQPITVDFLFGLIKYVANEIFDFPAISCEGRFGIDEEKMRKAKRFIKQSLSMYKGSTLPHLKTNLYSGQFGWEVSISIELDAERKMFAGVVITKKLQQGNPFVGTVAKTGPLQIQYSKSEQELTH